MLKRFLQMEIQLVVANSSCMLHLTPKIHRGCLTLKHKTVESPIGKRFNFYLFLGSGITSMFKDYSLGKQQNLFLRTCQLSRNYISLDKDHTIRKCMKI
jgi:hypothetical protein